MKLFALRVHLSHDYRNQSGVYIVVKDAIPDQVDSLACGASVASGAKVFILNPKALREVVALSAKLPSRIRGAHSWSRDNTLRLVGGVNASLAVEPESIEQACAVILVGVPRAPTLLYPFVEGVAEKGEVFSITRMSELISFVGNCADVLQRAAGCAGCSADSCYSKEPNSHYYATLDWLEDQVPEYLRPAQIHRVFATRHLEHRDVYPPISWEGEKNIRRLRSEYAVKARASKEKLRRDCSQCVEAQNNYGNSPRSCTRFKSICNGPVTSKELKEILLEFSKNRGLGTSPRSYVAQANMALAGFNVQLRVGDYRLQYWSVAYAYQNAPPYGRDGVTSVKPSKEGPGPLPNVPRNIYVYLYKPKNTYEAYPHCGITVRLRDLLRGLENLQGRAKRVYMREQWVKSTQETLLICNMLNAHPKARAASHDHSGWRTYDTWDLTLPTSTATVNRSGKLGRMGFRSDIRVQQEAYNVWLENTPFRQEIVKISDLIKRSKIGRLTSLLKGDYEGL